LVERPASKPWTRGFAAPLLVAAIGAWVLLARPAIVWLLAGLVALLLAAAVDELATRRPAALPWAGAAALLVAGGYQLSGLKARCLARWSAVAPALHGMGMS